MIFIVIGVVLSISVILLFVSKTKRPKGLPPGPNPLPIIGNLHLLTQTPHIVLQKLGKEYGPIFSFDLGLDKAVFLNDPHLIREAFNLKEVAGRARMDSLDLLCGGTNGLVLGQDNKWSERRRFAIRHLRVFGFGTKTMEEYIVEEVNELIDWARIHTGEPIALENRFNLAILNSMWRILSGKRFHHDDSRLIKIVEEFNVAKDYMTDHKEMSAFILFFPTVAKLFPNWSGWNYMAKLAKTRLQMLQKVVTEHKEFLPENYSSDFVDAYLHEVKNSDDPNSAFHESNEPDKALISIMDDFFAAGSESTSTTIKWAILYLLYNPKVQQKLYNELHSVIGISRAPNLSDRKNLPYTEATMMEILRQSSVVMYGIAHSAMADVKLNGYLIPKGFQIYANLYSVHHDPKFWEDPEHFRPERFLNPDGKVFHGHDAFLPFSTGKRSCYGETFSRDTMFLFLTTLLQNFELLFDESKLLPSLEIQGGFLLSPYPYTIVLKERLI